MKDILLSIIDNDKTYNKSATRYLYKTHPTLWTSIVDKTNFLPPDSKPKQRIWHILNDIWEIPKCPITGKEVKWWENRYLETVDKSAKNKNQRARGDFSNSHTFEINEKRKLSNKEAVKRGRKYRDTATYTEKQNLQRKITCLQKYGVENPSFSPVIKQKIYLKAVERGAVPREMRAEQRKYYDAVQYYTRTNYRLHKSKINPNNLPRNLFHLDHSFSVMAGFWNGIPPEVIGHWTNLQMLYSIDNLVKCSSCDTTIESLFDRYYCEFWNDLIIEPYG